MRRKQEGEGWGRVMELRCARNWGKTLATVAGGVGGDVGGISKEKEKLFSE